MSLLLWSSASFFVTTAATVACQRMTRKSESFTYVNEFACTVTWIAWCTELWLLGTYMSKAFSTAVVFLVVLLAPFVFQGARCNPCTLLYQYLVSPSPPPVLRILLANATAVAAAVGIMRALWALLGMAGSLEHAAFFESSRGILDAGLLEGCFVEMAATFFVYAPTKFVSSKVGLAFVQASMVTALSLFLGPYTGVVLNPLVAPSLYLMAGIYRPGELLAVYWVGPLLGAGLAALVPDYLSYSKDDKPKRI